MTKHNLEKSLNDWAMINQQDGEHVGAKTMLQSVGRIRVNLEKFSTWLLASAGAAAALIISNLVEIKSLISAVGIRYSLYALVVSAVFGIVSKYLSLVIKNMQFIANFIEKNLLQNLSDFHRDSDEINKISSTHGIEIQMNPILDKILNHYKEPFPFLIQFLIIRGFKKGQKDSLFVYKKVASLVFWLGVIIFLQGISAIASLIFIAWFSSL